jgi:hypothetical protein
MIEAATRDRVRVRLPRPPVFFEHGVSNGVTGARRIPMAYSRTGR